MTPYYYKTGAEDQKKLAAVQSLRVTTEFLLAVYQPHKLPPFPAGKTAPPGSRQGCLFHSTVTLFARLRGLSMSQPRCSAT